MKASITLTVLIVLSTTSCDRLFDLIVSNIEISIEEVIKDIPDETYFETCSGEKYLSTFKVTQQECINIISTRKPICVTKTTKKWPGNISSMTEMEDVANYHVKCVLSLYGQ